jgi:hypothetical protein
MKNNNQWDKNDPHKVMKLAEEEWNQSDTMAKTVNEHRAETIQRACPALDWIYPVSSDISDNIAGYVWPTQKLSSQL